MEKPNAQLIRVYFRVMGRGKVAEADQLLYEETPFASYYELVKDDLILHVAAESTGLHAGPHTPMQWQEAIEILDKADYEEHDLFLLPVLAGIVAMDQTIEEQGWVPDGHLQEIAHQAIQVVLFDGFTWRQALGPCRELANADPTLEAIFAQQRRSKSSKNLANVLRLFRNLSKEATSSQDRQALAFFEDAFRDYFDSHLNSRHCSDEELMRAIYASNAEMLQAVVDERSGSAKNTPPLDELGMDLILAKSIACRCRIIEDISGETLSHFTTWDEWAQDIADPEKNLFSLVDELAPQIAEDIDLMTRLGQTEFYRVIRGKVQEMPYGDDIRNINETERLLSVELANHLLGNYHPDRPRLIWPREATLPER